jgi:tetratricopeptide (TPR) repeat protein
LAHVPQVNQRIALQWDDALITNGDRGLLRWPIQETQPGQRQLGPPQLLHPRTFGDLAADRTGSVIAQARGDGAVLVRPGKSPTFVGPHGGAQKVAVSPDGKYVATSINDGEEGVKVWDAETRRLVAHFPVGALSGAHFSRDGKWLAVGGVVDIGRRCQVVKVGTWETAYDGIWEGGIFSPDGLYFVSESHLGIISFRESPGGRELARLEDPHSGSGWIALTPDGDKLLSSGRFDDIIRVWDLRAIRYQLAEMDLDWDAPPLPPRDNQPPSPIHVTVDLGPMFIDPNLTVGLSNVRLAFNAFDFEAYLERGRAHGRLKKPQEAIADYSMALSLLPADHAGRGELLFRRSNNYSALGDQAKADADLLQLAERDFPLPIELQSEAARQCNNLAWLGYLTGPENQRDPKRGLALALKAAKLESDRWEWLNTLGVAYYRAGDYPKAVETLQRSLDQNREMGAAFDLFFLAMCHHRLGEAKKSREEYDEAVRWFATHKGKLPDPSWQRELDEFQAEAKAVLAGPVKATKEKMP